MFVVDTNILVRIITNDTPVQIDLIKELVFGEKIHIPKTVILELVWVLKSSYQLTDTDVQQKLQDLLALSNVIVEDVLQVKRALKWYQIGLEFGDALHLASSLGADQFITFDKKLVKKANKLDNWKPIITTP